MKLRKMYFIVFLISLVFCASCSMLSDNCIFKRIKDEVLGDQKNQIYEIDDDYFYNFKFSKKFLVDANLTTGTSTYVPIIVIETDCVYKLTEVTYTAKVYSSDDELIFTHTETNQCSKGLVDEYFKVYENIYMEASYVLVTFSGKSNEQPNVYDKRFDITFCYNNLSSDIIKTVQYGKTISTPTAPVKKNYLFMGWYTDEQFTTEYDFSKPVYKDTKLYAKYVADYASLTNEITTNVMKCNVTVIAKSYNTFLGIETKSSTSSGSGIIFYESSSGYYYVLTNNHVTVKDNEYEKVSYQVEDYKGNVYTAYNYHDEPSYDLGVIYFKKGSEKLNVIKRAQSDPKIGEEIIAIGQPKGQNNAISFGKVEEYKTAPKLSGCEEYESNVKFNIMVHNSPTNNGSSGGAILNINLELVGIHYAGSRTNSGEMICGYAIPISKVEEFLEKYIWEK